MNEQRTKEERTMSEGVSKKYPIFASPLILQVQSYEKIVRYASKNKSLSGSCVKMRRNDIIKRKRGGDGGDDSI